MEYLTKVQAIRRKKGMVQCYVNMPLPLAAAIDLQPGEMVEWKVDNRYKLWLIRQRPFLSVLCQPAAASSRRHRHRTGRNGGVESRYPL